MLYGRALSRTLLSGLVRGHRIARLRARLLLRIEQKCKYTD